MLRLLVNLFLLWFLLLSSESFAQSKITLSQGRNGAVISVPSISEAGGNLTSSVETSSSFVVLSITSYNKYQISVRRQDVNWNNNLDFYVRRTGNGIGTRGSSISGGTNYVLLNTFNQALFTGFRTRYNIPIQYKVGGISLTVPSGDHSTYVVYTITDN